MSNIAKRVEAEVLSWPGVEKHIQRFGGVGFWLNGHELGHIHGNWLADLPFSGQTKTDLIASGLVAPHHIRPEKDWVTYHIHRSGSAEDLIRLFRLNYDHFAHISTPAPLKEGEASG